MKRAALLLLMLAFCGPNYGGSPVVVELFTSQGCSSCPPADALLRKIANDPALRGKVIPLAYHVDYWNHLGWRDPFSSRAWSERQGEYVRAMKLNSAYTPQAVVNGSRQMVGSSSMEVYRAIEEESRRPSSDSVSLDREGVIRATASSEVHVMLVVFENGITTKVARGENEGKTLVNDAIVRRLERVATVRGTMQYRVPLQLAPREGAAVFLQDVKTNRITAASRL